MLRNKLMQTHRRLEKSCNSHFFKQYEDIVVHFLSGSQTVNMALLVHRFYGNVLLSSNYACKHSSLVFNKLQLNPQCTFPHLRMTFISFFRVRIEIQHFFLCLW